MGECETYESAMHYDCASCIENCPYRKELLTRKDALIGLLIIIGTFALGIWCVIWLFI